ncbi:hypothetical protein G7Y89_g87 [Cudoniella acicularis]|uniref:NB-ARC domain-containing protein n=1 Tax=Cudoniella acicularis TaxID=354080 RepID=A0A8H4RZE3_9HELO|nr:hypothetical protein G7Y89_g87 [Cudoniella acicularis]
MRTPGNTFIDHLKRDSLFSESLTDQFKHQYKDYRILSFYETKFFKGTTSLAVEKESAVLGLAGTRETAIALNTDHSQICKFGEVNGVKAQLAVKYAYWLHTREPDTSIFWIHASNTERFHHSYLELAQSLEIPQADSTKVDILALVKGWLERKGSGKWLMIIDNADDFDMFFDTKQSSVKLQTIKLADYIPDGSHGSVLLMTRDKNVAVRSLKSSSPLSLINVLAMRQSEATELVHQVLAGEEYNDENIQELTKSLEYLPSAITHAAAFILENYISIGIYLQRYIDNKDDAIELLSHDFEALGRDRETRNVVATAWMVSFKQIKDQNPQAANILSLMAFLDRHCVPEELLRKYREPNSSTDFEKACGTLKAFSLIEGHCRKATSSFQHAPNGSAGDTTMVDTS